MCMSTILWDTLTSSTPAGVSSASIASESSTGIDGGPMPHEEDGVGAGGTFSEFPSTVAMARFFRPVSFLTVIEAWARFLRAEVFRTDVDTSDRGAGGSGDDAGGCPRGWGGGC